MKGIKDKIAAMKKKVKGKIAAKIKGKKKAVAVAGLAAGIIALAGCMETQPASRATSATITKPCVEVAVGNNVSNVTVTAYIHVQDVAQSSADSKGSTETQTATPTMDIRPDLDVNYNDALKKATDASWGVLDLLTEAGQQAVLKLMASKVSGVVSVPAKNGDSIQVQCENGQCSVYKDCER